MRVNRLLPVLVFLLAATLLGGCFGSDKKDETATSASAAASPTVLTADSVLAAAAQRWSQTQSAHFKLTIDGTAYIDDQHTIELREAEGDLARPASVQAKAKVAAALATLDIQLIGVGTDMYITNFITGNWEKAPADFGYNPSVLFDDTSGIGAVVQQIGSPKLEQPEKVNGREANVVSGVVPQAIIDRLTAGAIVADSIPVKVWVAQDNGDILKVVITPPQTEANQAGTWTLEVTNHDKPVTIEPPALASPTS